MTYRLSSRVNRRGHDSSGAFSRKSPAKQVKHKVQQRAWVDASACFDLFVLYKQLSCAHLLEPPSKARAGKRQSWRCQLSCHKVYTWSENNYYVPYQRCISIHQQFSNKRAVARSEKETTCSFPVDRRRTTIHLCHQTSFIIVRSS